MSAKIKNIILVVLCAVFLFSFPIWGLIKPDEEISKSERRPLQKFPVVSVDNIVSGKFMTDFESYTLDHFPLRDNFRTLKSYTAFYAFRQQDNNDIYIAEGYASKLEYPLNKDSASHATDRFKYVYDTYLEGNTGNIYLSIVPDKNFFLAEKNGYLSIDYNALISQVTEDMPYAQYIDITNKLDIADYYTTDSHWKQEEIIPVAQHLAENTGVTLKSEYTQEKVDTPFYGVYAGQSALPLKPDTITILKNDYTENYKVYDFETDSYIPVYDKEKLNGNDPYEIYLAGPKSLLVIENPQAETDKELIIFRDSYTSSLAPLLCEGYAKVTLVDIRYLSPEMLSHFITFDKQDVLFMYSTSVLNNSVTIK